MTIERALTWAFTIELPNLSPASDAEDGGLPSVHPMWKGARVDGGRAGWEDAAIARMVDGDALKIGAATARLRDGIILDPPDFLDREERRAFIAWRGRAETLVIYHARLGKAPDASDLPIPYPLRSGNGRPVVRRLAPVVEKTIAGDEFSSEREQLVDEGPAFVVARGKTTRGKYPWGSFCPLEYLPTFESVARDRAEYQVWRAALDKLAQELAALDRIAVLPTDASWRPWATAKI